MMKALLIFRIMILLSYFKPFRWWMGGKWYKIKIRKTHDRIFNHKTPMKHKYTTCWVNYCPSPFDSPYETVLEEENYETLASESN